MADPITWKAVQAIATACAVITVAGGYHTDLGSNVDTELEQVATGSVRLAVAMGRLRPISLASKLREKNFEVALEAYLPTASSAQGNAHKALEDLMRVFPETTRLSLSGGGEVDVAVVDSDIQRRPEGFDGVVVQVLLSAQVREALA